MTTTDGQKWRTIEGIDGRTYNYRYFVAYDPHGFDGYNDALFKHHILFEFLDMLGICQYVKDYDHTYEVIIRARE